jgi:hypothetical protein
MLLGNLGTLAAELQTGSVAVIEPDRIRIRKLPLLPSPDPGRATELVRSSGRLPTTKAQALASPEGSSVSLNAVSDSAATRRCRSREGLEENRGRSRGCAR